MELKGDGFLLRGWKMEDAESLQKHADNTAISDFLLYRFPSPYTMEDAIHWIKIMQYQNPVLNFSIDINGNAVGAIGLELKEDVYRKTALLGYWIGEDFWGHGIMPKAVKLITDYAFKNLDIIRIQADIFSNNPKSMRVLQGVGFTKEAVLKKAIIKNGMILDEHIYALVRTDHA